MIQRIYIDTSIVGGYFDEEFQVATKQLFARLVMSEIKFVISDILDLELLKAPKKVRELLDNFPRKYFEKVKLTKEASDLSDKYIAEKVVGKSSIEDCRHIALATINRVDILASWNFKHIVNLDRIKGYNSINLRFGYPVIEIRSPLELIKHEND